MSTFIYAITDSAVVFRRSLRRILRYPSTLILVGMPLRVPAAVRLCARRHAGCRSRP